MVWQEAMRQIVLVLIALLGTACFASPGCVGKMTNPVTDVCWKCLFPIHIMGFQVVGSAMPDKKRATNMPLCMCTKPPLPWPMPGIPISFWEPVRLVDVTKSPMCLVSFGGLSLGQGPQRGMQDGGLGDSFYQVHWYIYPFIYWLELLTDFACLDKSAVDLAYLTEYDFMWNNDAKSTIINPEAILFGTSIAQKVCTADCAKASTGLPLDILFWCCGCQGSMYPYTGTNGSQNGAVQGSVLLVARMIAKLHRELLLWATWGPPMVSGTCSKYPLPLIEKSAYRIQMTYPIPETSSCKRLGQTEVTWQAGKEFPYKGEDFAYLVWHKRECCLGAL